MARIEQLSDGSYVKVLDVVEIESLVGLNGEAKIRQASDAALQAALTDLAAQLGRGSQEILNTNTNIGIEALARQAADAQLMAEIAGLKVSPTITPYSKEETKKMLVPWKVEEIQHLFTTPTNEIFDNTLLKDIKVGYEFFEKAQLNVPNTLAFKENTMRRYTISAYVSTPVIINLQVNHNDDCSIYLTNSDGTSVRQLMDSNIEMTPSLVTLSLKTGWNKIQVLIANQSTQGAINIGIPLADKVEALSCLEFASGKIDGEHIAVGTISHLNMNADDEYTLKSLKLTTTATSGLWVGNETQGSIRIGDGYLVKQADQALSIVGGISTGQASSLLGNVTLGTEGSATTSITVNIPWAGGFAPYTKSQIHQLLTDMGLTVPQTWVQSLGS